MKAPDRGLDRNLDKDNRLTNKVGTFMRRFPHVWQPYQGWLSDITASRSSLLERYPAWQAGLIFRWRLFYFVVYVGCVLFSSWLRGRFVVQYRYGLQRIATLLSVVELTLCGVAALTGILLAFYYQPTAQGAHASLAMIARDVAGGSLILSLHNVAGNGLIALALVQIVVMYLGREFLLSWFASWLSGLFLAIAAIGLSWTATVLNWEQIGFWRFKIELGTIASVPLVGPSLRDILAGSGGISNLTMQHMYTLHSYVLAIAALLISVTHLAALILQEQTWKPPKTQLSWANLFGKYISEGDSHSD
ncbi:MAG: cytochrome b N-terminal domain-containing protein [Cyanobacteria bacterium J06635_1]